MTNMLLSDIDAHLKRTGMSEYRFGYLAAKNGRLVSRLRSGGRIWPETEAKVREYLDKNSGGAAPKSPREPLRAAS